MIQPLQFSQFVIEAPLSILSDFAPVTKDTAPQASDQLFMLAAHESKLGTYLKQLGKGSALGVYQMEPETVSWLVGDYLNRTKVTGFKACLHAFAFPDTFSPSGFNHALFAINLAAQTVAARALLWSKPEKLPNPADYPLGRSDLNYLKAHAAFAKKHWNTPAGKATPEDYLNAYLKHRPAT